MRSRWRRANMGLEEGKYEIGGGGIWMIFTFALAQTSKWTLFRICKIIVIFRSHVN